jgi:hypothetical protein
VRREVHVTRALLLLSALTLLGCGDDARRDQLEKEVASLKTQNLMLKAELEKLTDLLEKPAANTAPSAKVGYLDDKPPSNEAFRLVLKTMQTCKLPCAKLWLRKAEAIDDWVEDVSEAKRESFRSCALRCRVER